MGPRSVDWAKLVANKDREIRRLNGVYEKLLDEAGVERIEARARIADPHTVEVNGRTVTEERVPKGSDREAVLEVGKLRAVKLRFE